MLSGQSYGRIYIQDFVYIDSKRFNVNISQETKIGRERRQGKGKEKTKRNGKK
jgi:hypothetical protein